MKGPELIDFGLSEPSDNVQLAWKQQEILFTFRVLRHFARRFWNQVFT